MCTGVSSREPSAPQATREADDFAWPSAFSARQSCPGRGAHRGPGSTVADRSRFVCDSVSLRPLSSHVDIVPQKAQVAAEIVTP